MPNRIAYMETRETFVVDRKKNHFSFFFDFKVGFYGSRVISCFMRQSICTYEIEKTRNSVIFMHEGEKQRQ